MDDFTIQTHGCNLETVVNSLRVFLGEENESVWKLKEILPLGSKKYILLKLYCYLEECSKSSAPIEEGRIFVNIECKSKS